MKTLSILSAAALMAGNTTAQDADIVAKQDNVAGNIQSILTTSGEHAGLKWSLLLETPLAEGTLSPYLTYWTDTRIASWEEDFLAGGVKWQGKNLSLHGRGLILDNEQFGELFAGYKDTIDQWGMDYWMETGLTFPEGWTLRGGIDKKLPENFSLSVKGFLKEDQKGGSTAGDFIKLELSQKIGDFSWYIGTDIIDGNDNPYPAAYMTDVYWPASLIPKVHGEGITVNTGIKHTTENGSTHIKASYNEGDYWNFTGEIQRNIGNNWSILGGILVDTRNAENPTGYFGIKKVF